VNKNIHKNIKTLVILIGNARGGEETWQSMYKYLLDPFSADLGLLFGKTNNKSSSLYKKAKYLWEIEEYNNWRKYYENNVEGNWNNFFFKGLLAGGIDNYKGSGAILLALRHFLNNNFKNILLKYERIILTRSDYFYINYHPILSNSYFYIPEGEDYGGICDRHHVFPSYMANEVLGVVEFFSDIKNYNYLKNKDLSNLERLLFEFYQHNGIIKNIKRFNRVQFTVSSNNEQTRSKSGRGYLFGSKSLQIKYQREYYLALKNKYGLVIGFFLRFIFHFFKKK
jgi:hypothetical protein